MVSLCCPVCIFILLKYIFYLFINLPKNKSMSTFQHDFPILVLISFLILVLISYLLTCTFCSTEEIFSHNIVCKGYQAIYTRSLNDSLTLGIFLHLLQH